jgi:hypothetical protein
VTNSGMQGYLRQRRPVFNRSGLPHVFKATV